MSQFMGICNTSHVTLYPSHFTLHTSPVTLHPSHFTRHTSPVTLHPSHFTRHTPHVAGRIPHGTLRRRSLFCCRPLPLATRHTSRITRHTSHTTHHTSHVTHHASHVTRHTPNHTPLSTHHTLPSPTGVFVTPRVALRVARCVSVFIRSKGTMTHFTTESRDGVAGGVWRRLTVR